MKGGNKCKVIKNNENLESETFKNEEGRETVRRQALGKLPPIGESLTPSSKDDFIQSQHAEC